jgi:hypothetical protein
MLVAWRTWRWCAGCCAPRRYALAYRPSPHARCVATRAPPPPTSSNRNHPTCCLTPGCLWRRTEQGSGGEVGARPAPAGAQRPWVALVTVPTRQTLSARQTLSLVCLVACHVRYGVCCRYLPVAGAYAWPRPSRGECLGWRACPHAKPPQRWGVTRCREVAPLTYLAVGHRLMASIRWLERGVLLHLATSARDSPPRTPVALLQVDPCCTGRRTSPRHSPFPVAPRQTLTLRFAFLSIAVRSSRWGVPNNVPLLLSLQATGLLGPLYRKARSQEVLPGDSARLSNSTPLRRLFGSAGVSTRAAGCAVPRSRGTLSTPQAAAPLSH